MYLPSPLIVGQDGLPLLPPEPAATSWTPCPPSLWYIQRPPAGGPPSPPPPPRALFRTTMNVPSGVHVGSNAVVFRSEKTAFGFDPSAFIVQRLYCPRRSVMNAMVLPSGEMRGWKFSATPEFCVRTVASPPD